MTASVAAVADPVTDNDPDLFPVPAATDRYGWPVGAVLLTTHGIDQCAGRACVIHAPSGHHMTGWPLQWRADRAQVERVCPCHHTGHPDPDDVAWNESLGRTWAAVHGCAGCCLPPEADREGTP